MVECSGKEYGDVCIHNHHILPKCMNGSNKKTNLIQLGIEDHYTAHQVLANCFPDGHLFRSYNNGACQLIFNSATNALQQIYGSVFYENLSEFWKAASIALRDAPRGKNNYMFGKTHTDEAKLKISKTHKGRKLPEYRVQQLKEQSKGERNPMYGTTRITTPETRLKIGQSTSELNKIKWPLPKTVIKLDTPITINGKNKSFYRHCPDCNGMIYYAQRWDATDSDRNNCKCASCKSKQSAATRKANGFEMSEEHKAKFIQSRLNSPNIGKHDKRASKNPNARTILNPETGEVYSTIRELANVLKISSTKMTKEIKSGKYVVLGKTNAPTK